jgi:hypothetical protein
MKKYLLWIACAVVVAGCKADDKGWNDSVIPVSLVGIQAVNIDNSGEFPILATDSIIKEAYMVGIRWITDHITSANDYITGPIQWGDQTYESLSDKYTKRIWTNNQFNSSTPAGSNISSFFKEINRNYLPPDMDEGFVLLVAPTPGVHSFRVEYWLGGTLAFFYDTESIILR